MDQSIKSHTTLTARFIGRPEIAWTNEAREGENGAKRGQVQFVVFRSFRQAKFQL